MKQRIDYAYKNCRFEYYSLICSNFNKGKVAEEEIAAFINFYAKSRFLHCLSLLYCPKTKNKVHAFGMDFKRYVFNLNITKNNLKRIARFYDGKFERKFSAKYERYERKKFGDYLVTIANSLSVVYNLDHSMILIENGADERKLIEKLVEDFDKDMVYVSGFFDWNLILEIVQGDLSNEIVDVNYKEEQFKKLLCYRLLSFLYTKKHLQKEHKTVKVLVSEYIIKDLFHLETEETISPFPMNYYKGLLWN